MNSTLIKKLTGPFFVSRNLSIFDINLTIIGSFSPSSFKILPSGKVSSTSPYFSKTSASNLNWTSVLSHP